MVAAHYLHIITRWDLDTKNMHNNGFGINTASGRVLPRNAKRGDADESAVALRAGPGAGQERPHTPLVYIFNASATADHDFFNVAKLKESPAKAPARRFSASSSKRLQRLCVEIWQANVLGCDEITSACLIACRPACTRLHICRCRRVDPIDPCIRRSVVFVTRVVFHTFFFRGLLWYPK